MRDTISRYLSSASIFAAGGISLYLGIINTSPLAKMSIFLAGACFSAGVWSASATYFRKSLEEKAQETYANALFKLMDGVVEDLKAELKRRGLEDVSELKINHPTRH